MKRVLTGAALAALAAAGATGCHGTAGGTAGSLSTSFTSMKQAVGLAPEPVSTVLTFWQRRLAKLQDGDPRRDGMMVEGMVGQVFMISPSSNHTVAQGDLTIALYDMSPRQPGQPERPYEVFHFDQETLNTKLRSKDERFGECYAVFLNWPASWADVTNVKIIARYQTPDGASLMAKEVVMQLDSGPEQAVWEGQNLRQVGNVVPGAVGPDLRGVPDPRLMLEAMRAGKSAPPLEASKPEMSKGTPIRRSNVPVMNGFPDSAGQPLQRTQPPQQLPPTVNPPAQPAGAAVRPPGAFDLPAGGEPVMKVVERTPVVQLPKGQGDTPYATDGASAGPRPQGGGLLGGMTPAPGQEPAIVIRRGE